MNFAITGLGAAAPSHTMNQAEGLELAERVLAGDEEKLRTLRAIYRRAGVDKRHTCVPYQTGFAWTELPMAETPHGPQRRGASTDVRMQIYREHAPPLAIAAARQALAASAVPPRDISHLVTVSCTGFTAPGVDAALIDALELPLETERVNIGFMGCHGAINGLRAAKGLAAEDPTRRVLMVAVELCSLHYFFGDDADKLVSNALFADGAAALVGEAASERAAPKSKFRVLATGSTILPDTAGDMSWNVGDHGFEMTLAATVPERIATTLRPWLTRWLDRQGVSLAEIEHWAIHPGGPRIVSAVAESLELLPEATQPSRDVLANYGNMSSPTVLFIARRLMEQNAQGLGLMIAFGPGLAAEVALVEF